jgi:hypothetical protein
MLIFKKINKNKNKMPGLEAFLLTWIDELFPITKCFPQSYSNNKTIAELLIITKNLIDCGKGILQHKNKIFYYRTYIPSSLSEDESNSKKSSSFTDYVYSSNSSNVKKVFLLFLCDINYKKKNIDKLTKKIFEVLDEGAFDKQDLKKESSRKINFLYEQYKNPETNSDNYIQLKDIDEVIEIDTGSNKLIDDSYDNKNENKKLLNENLINGNNEDDSGKKNNSRIIWSKLNKDKSHGGSIDINDLTSIKDNESDLSIIFKQSLDENLNLSQMKKMKTIKKINIILCSVLFLISLILIILLYAL